MPSLSYQITTINRCARAFRAKRLEGTDLLVPHIHYILIICANPGATQDALVKNLFTGKSNVTRALSKLEELGYIERRTCESDKRAQRVYPTAKAEEILPLCRQIERDWNAVLTETLCDGEKSTLEDLVQKIASAARHGAENLSGDNK